MDALRRRVRFVWTSATLVGVMGRARRAAAAAAAEREVLESWRRKTAAAAAWAAASAGWGIVLGVVDVIVVVEGRVRGL